MERHGEFLKFIGVMLTADISGIYCFTVSKSTRPGPHRVLLLLPAAAAFTFLPLTLPSYHLGGAAFFYLTWLANSKLLLFSFGSGPLSGLASASLLHFLCVLLLPVKLGTDLARPGPVKTDLVSSRALRWAKAAAFGGKVLGFGLLVVPYSYKEVIPENVLVGLHLVHMYVSLEISLAVIGVLTRSGFGLKMDLEVVSQFDEPYLSTSLQDFWGRRWNLIASDILKQTVHNRIRNHSSRTMGKKTAILIGVLTSFMASGLMHELMYYYITRVSPTWEVMQFFMFHGVCVIVEFMVKKTVPSNWRLHRAISTPLTLGFLASTAVWLLFPSLLRNRIYEKGCDEYLVMADYVKRSVVYFFGVEKVNPNITVATVESILRWWPVSRILEVYESN